MAGGGGVGPARGIVSAWQFSPVRGQAPLRCPRAGQGQRAASPLRDTVCGSAFLSGEAFALAWLVVVSGVWTKTPREGEADASHERA